MHATVECRQCHANMIFREASTRCADCHADLHRRQLGTRMRGLPQREGLGGEDASRCASIRRASRCSGAHASVDCETCHKGAAAAQFRGLSTACAACHINDFSHTKTINHVAAKFPVTCEQCHAADNWLSVRFDHTRLTGFALVGTHSHAGLRQLPRGQPLRGHAGHLLRLPRQGFRRHHEPQSRGGGHSHGLLALPHVEQLAEFHLQSRRLQIPADRGARQHAVRAVPRQQSVRQHAHAVLGLPLECVPDGGQSQSRCLRLSDHVRDLPQHQRLAAATFNHSRPQIPATGAHTTRACAQCHVNGERT